MEVHHDVAGARVVLGGLHVAYGAPRGQIGDIVGDVVVVQEGIGQEARILAGTFRETAAYPVDDSVHDVCRLYNKEKAFGLNEVPSFEVRFQPIPGGVQCS